MNGRPLICVVLVIVWTALPCPARSPRNRQKDPEDEECALVLQRVYPRKGFDRGRNFLDTEPVDKEMCIRYSDVNSAVKEARKRTNYRHPIAVGQTLEPLPEDTAETAELTLEVTKILADRFRLSREEIMRGLPLIDTSRTDLWPLCPSFVKPIPCSVEKFRTYTAHCNNIRHSSWGATHTAFARFLPPAFEDGISTVRLSVSGRPLPSPRLISSVVHRDAHQPSRDYTSLFMSFGQFIDHDLTFAALTGRNGMAPIQCCDTRERQADEHPLCMPINIPRDDPFYSRFGRSCMELTRNLATHRPDCTLGPRMVQNTLTGPIDANFIYGSTERLALALRERRGGLMRTWNMFEKERMKPMLPPLTSEPDRDCIARPRNLYCFDAGDSRANEQVFLAMLHTLYVREHNRIATILGDLNPHWDDERIYQETRNIMAAVSQHITFKEYLPLVLSEEDLFKYNLTLADEGYWNGYNPEVHVELSNAFQVAAFRFGHSQVFGGVTRYNKFHEFIAEFELRKVLRQPYILYTPGMMDELMLGMINAPAQNTDPFMSDELTNHMFERPDEKFGFDLASINIQRSRDHGIPGYNFYREWCGLPRARTFEEMGRYLSNDTAFKYSEIYGHPDDVDLWSAGISEYRVEGAVVGPTFSCILARQFANSRQGDRFWYENGGFPSSFTPEQLQQIRKSNQARIICENSDDMPTIQPFAFRLSNPHDNPRVPCEDLPTIDLGYWKERRN